MQLSRVRASSVSDGPGSAHLSVQARLLGRTARLRVLDADGCWAGAGLGQRLPGRGLDGFAERASPRWPNSWARTCCGLLRSAGRGAHWRRNIRLNGSAGAGRGSWMKATPTGSSTVAWRCWQAALEPVRPLIARAPSLVVGNIHRRSTQSQRPEGSIALCFAPLAASPPLRCPASLPARSIWPCNRPHTYRRIPRQARHSRTYPAPRPRYLACPESAYGDAFRATA